MPHIERWIKDGVIEKMMVDGVEQPVKPLISNLTKNLKPCSGCGNSLGNQEYDQFWKSKEKKDDASMGSDQANSGGSGDTRGSSWENQ